MTRAPPLQRPQAVLFACGLNSVRSPMAAALLRQMLGTKLYVGSAGVRKGELDPFAAAAMEEHGIDISAHRPTTFEELEDWEGLKAPAELLSGHHAQIERWRRDRRLEITARRRPDLIEQARAEGRLGPADEALLAKLA